MEKSDEKGGINFGGAMFSRRPLLQYHSLFSHADIRRRRDSSTGSKLNDVHKPAERNEHPTIKALYPSSKEGHTSESLPSPHHHTTTPRLVDRQTSNHTRETRSDRNRSPDILEPTLPPLLSMSVMRARKEREKGAAASCRSVYLKQGVFGTALGGVDGLGCGEGGELGGEL